MRKIQFLINELKNNDVIDADEDLNPEYNDVRGLGDYSYLSILI